MDRIVELNGLPHLKAFIEKHKEHNFQVIVGECGFGHPCVGIIKDNHYLEYAKFHDDFTLAAESNVAVEFMAKDGYQKNPSFCVTYNKYVVNEAGESTDVEETPEVIQERIKEALLQLDGWMRPLNRYGYILESYDKKTVFDRRPVFYVRNPDNANILDMNF